MSDQTTEKLLDRDKLRHAIQEEYEEVALNPEKGFHFHTGRRLAGILGYDETWLQGIPESSIESFAGTGNPFSIEELKPGEKVVDIGCGAGIDSIIAARMVAPTGQVVGVDMTPNMLEKAIWIKLFSLSCMPSLVLGNVYYVDFFNGSNANDGLTPNSPFLTITYALTLCVNDHDDYIIVMEHYQEVVTISKSRVHIIGVGSNPNYSFVQMNAAADTAIFLVTNDSYHCEIAGFSFGGGTNHAGIENAVGVPMGLYIHDCQFGHNFAGGTPEDGIRISVNATDIRVERCSFYGTPGGKGLLTRDGIRWETGNPLNGTIIDNQFLALPGVAIDFVAVAPGEGGITIKDNVISCGADTQGDAITLGATCRGFLVVGNRAMFGKGTPALGTNPYLDGAGADDNHWVDNWAGNGPVDPA